MMIQNANDAILDDLKAIARRARLLYFVDFIILRISVSLALAGFGILLIPSHLSIVLASFFAYLLLIAATGILSAARTDLHTAAHLVDSRFQLPDSFTAYLEYMTTYSRNAFMAAHLRQIRVRFPGGIQWRPPHKGRLKHILFNILITALLLLAFSLNFRTETAKQLLEVTLDEQDAAILSDSASILKDSCTFQVADALDKSVSSLRNKNIPSEGILKTMQHTMVKISGRERRLVREYLSLLHPRDASFHGGSEGLRSFVKESGNGSFLGTSIETPASILRTEPSPTAGYSDTKVPIKESKSSDSSADPNSLKKKGLGGNTAGARKLDDLRAELAALAAARLVLEKVFHRFHFPSSPAEDGEDASVGSSSPLFSNRSTYEPDQDSRTEILPASKIDLSVPHPTFSVLEVADPTFARQGDSTKFDLFPQVPHAPFPTRKFQAHDRNLVRAYFRNLLAAFHPPDDRQKD